MNLTLQPSISSLVINLAERTRVNVQIGISGYRMVEHIACIHTQRQSLRLRNIDRLQEIRVEAPHSRPGERIQSERSELSRRSIPQDNFSVGICKRIESAKRCERCGHTGARRIGHSLVLLRKEIAECVALFEWPDDLSLTRKLSDNVWAAGAGDGLPADAGG